MNVRERTHLVRLKIVDVADQQSVASNRHGDVLQSLTEFRQICREKIDVLFYYHIYIQLFIGRVHVHDYDNKLTLVG